MDRIKIGWGRRVISIDEPVSIPGQMYTRVSEGILDSLYATAVCMDGGAGQEYVIFCSLDVTVMRRGFMYDVLEKVKEKKPEINVDNIICNATHTHTSCHMNPQPETTPDGRPIYPSEKWRAFATVQVADAIIEAYETKNEGGIAYGYGYAVVAHSRRSTYLVDKGGTDGSSSNGFAIMYGKTNDPDFAGYEAGADHFVNLMYTFDAANKLTGIIINVPCPSQITETYVKLTADFWANVREKVAEKYGPDVYVLTQCAAAGDLSPRILHYHLAQRRRFDLKYDMKYGKSTKDVRGTDYWNKVMGERKDIAERIMTAVNEVYEWASKDIETVLPIQHEMKSLDLQRRMITEEELQYAENVLATAKLEIPEGLSAEEEQKLKDRFDRKISRNKGIIERFNTQNQETTVPSRVHVLRIGDVGFATCRFEFYMDYMHRIQARSPFVQTFFIQLAGEENGSYLPTERSKGNKGYGSSMYESQFGPEAGRQIVENAVETLTRMAEEYPISYTV